MCADSMLMRARLGPTPTKEAEEEFLKYQQTQQKLNEEHNADALKESTTNWLERRATQQKLDKNQNATGSMDKRETELRKDPMLKNAEVTFTQMCAMHQKNGEDLNTDQLRQHWNNLQMVTTDSQCETTAGYCKLSYATMCSMLDFRGRQFSDKQLRDQWKYLKQVEEDEAREEPMLCAQGCGQLVTRGKKTLSPEAQYELLKNSCCTPCWMHTFFPEEYARLGWDKREAHHGGVCLQDLLKNQPRANKDIDAPEATEWHHLEKE